MVPRVVLGLAAALVMLAVTPVSVAACSCGGTTEDSALANADVAFVGVVVRAEEPNFLSRFLSSGADPILYTFVVEESRKGSLGAFVTVRTYRDGAACGVTMAVGERWSIYAHQQDLYGETRPGELWVWLCDANEKLATGMPAGGVAVAHPLFEVVPADYLWLLLLAGVAIVVGLLALFRSLDKRVSRGGQGQSPGTGAAQDPG